MNYAIWKKNFNDARLLLLALALYVIIFSWARVYIVSELDTSQFRQILDLLPDSLKSFTPVDFEWLISYTGRIAFNFDEPMLVGAIAIWCIARASDVVSGQLSGGTMEMLLAQPVSRLSHYSIHCLVTLLGVLIISLATWFGMWAGVSTATVEITTKPELNIPYLGIGIPMPFLPDKTEMVPMRQLVDCMSFWPGVVNLFTLGFFLTAMTAFFSSWDMYRWRTIGIVTGIYVIAALIKVMAMSIERLAWTSYFSFFSLYEPEVAIAEIDRDPNIAYQWVMESSNGIVSLGPLSQNAIYLGWGLAFFVVGFILFRRRDLPAPL